MPHVRLSMGRVDYLDTGGDGPVLLLLHGVNMDASLWRNVIAGLPDFRCIAPTLPLGSHKQPMDRPELVTHGGVAAMVGELMDALDLRETIVVANDWGGVQFLLADGPRERISAAALVACEAFDNFPPGRPGRALAASARVPGLLWLSVQLQRFDWFRRAPGGWGWMSKRPVPRAVMDSWFAPALHDPGVRRDLRTFALSTPPRSELHRLVEQLPSFDRPVLVVWATEDKLMPAEHGPRLAGLFPRGQLALIDDSYTLVPEDQPDQLVRELVRFVGDVEAER